MGVGGVGKQEGKMKKEALVSGLDNKIDDNGAVF